MDLVTIELKGEFEVDTFIYHTIVTHSDD